MKQQETVTMLTFTEEILDEKLHYLYSAIYVKHITTSRRSSKDCQATIYKKLRELKDTVAAIGGVPDKICS